MIHGAGQRIKEGGTQREQGAGIRALQYTFEKASSTEQNNRRNERGCVCVCVCVCVCMGVRWPAGGLDVMV